MMDVLKVIFNDNIDIRYKVSKKSSKNVKLKFLT